MARKVVGWLLLLVGIGGIIVNIVSAVLWGSSLILIGNTVICLVFVFGGWRLAHPKPVTGGMIR